MKEKICSETGDYCEYEPADDEPCHQCRIFREIEKIKNQTDDKVRSCIHDGFRIEV